VANGDDQNKPQGIGTPGAPGVEPGSPMASTFECPASVTPPYRGEPERSVDRVQAFPAVPCKPAVSPRSDMSLLTASLPDCRECLGAIAHRLAQPITALRGGIELGLMGKHSASNYRTLLEQSMELADSMAEMICSLRDLGDAGAPAAAATHVLLVEVVEEAVAALRLPAESRGLRLRLVPSSSVLVPTDRGRLREALQSLLTWIVQNSAGGDEVRIHVTVREKEAHLLLSLPHPDAQYLQVKVLEAASSPGLLFSHASKYGTLGWEINRRLIEGLGGRIEMLTDAVNAGSVRISLPLASAAEAAPRPERSSNNGPDG